MENAHGRLLLVPTAIEAAEACSRIFRKVAGTVAVPFPIEEPVGEEADRVFRLLAEWGADPGVGGVIVMGNGVGGIDPALLASAIRANAKPVETIDISRVGGTNQAVRYGTGLAESMLLLLKRQPHARSLSLGPVRYDGGSRWLDDFAGEEISKQPRAGE